MDRCWCPPFGGVRQFLISNSRRRNNLLLFIQLNATILSKSVAVNLNIYKRRIYSSNIRQTLIYCVRSHANEDVLDFRSGPNKIGSWSPCWWRHFAPIHRHTYMWRLCYQSPCLYTDIVHIFPSYMYISYSNIDLLKLNQGWYSIYICIRIKIIYYLHVYMYHIRIQIQTYCMFAWNIFIKSS